MPYLIDGNNLLGVILGHDEDFAPVTDAQLCGDISRYLAGRGASGELVFDGSGPHNKAPFHCLRALDVCFAGTGSDADTVIESKLHACPQPRRMVVVSDDRRLRGAARSYRARSLRCLDFWPRVVAFKTRRPGPSEPAGKRHGLSDRETREWMESFGLEGNTQ
jgi:hypothetical protein